MKDKQIKLNSTDSISLQKVLESRLLIQANSGSGKSWIIRRILEQSHGKVQQIVLDLEGEFATLREKYEYLLVGKGGDVPVSVRTAGLLAHKLLEHKASAIIDLYELQAHERKLFAKLFIESMVNAPKELWHNCLVFIDEAHVLCPEKGESEAMSAVIDLATRGRKRGYCAILATQRISKLHKDAAAECNNKLIGRSAQDIDMKRASDELGFTSREQTLSLRALKPGEFYAFGPAISDEVKKLKVGEVKTSHPKVGGRSFVQVSPPTEKIKNILQKMSDLPQEVEKKVQTEKELREEISRLKRDKNLPDQKTMQRSIQVAVQQAKQESASMIQNLTQQIKKYETVFSQIGKLLNMKMPEVKAIPVKMPVQKPSKPVFRPVEEPVSVSDESELTNPEKRILNAMAWLESIGVTEPEQTAVAFLAKYTVDGGAFMNPRGKLRVKGLISYNGSKLSLTQAGRLLAEAPDETLTTEELHRKVLSVLPNPEQRLLKPLIERYPEDMSHEELAELSEYTFGAGAFNNPRGRLKTLGLVEYTQKGRIKAADLLFLDI